MTEKVDQKIKKPNWQNLSGSEYMLIFVIGLLLYFIFVVTPGSRLETEKAQILASSATATAKANQKRIEELEHLNSDMMLLLKDMAGNNQKAREKIALIEAEHQMLSDSSTHNIEGQKKFIDDLFDQFFKDLNKKK